MLSYVDPHMLPAFAAQITVELDLSCQQFGLLTGFAMISQVLNDAPLSIQSTAIAFTMFIAKVFERPQRPQRH